MARPDGPESKRFPAVLMLHGFPGSEKNVDIQRRLMDKGIASLSLHFCGAWGSEGIYRFTTLVPQALCALRYLKAKPFVDPRRLGIFGFSMGGWAAINAAAKVPAIKAVAAVAPVGGPEMVTPGIEESVKYLSQSIRCGSLSALGRDFTKAVRTQDPARSAAKITAPLLLVHGKKDDLIPPAVSARIFGAAAEPKKMVWAPGYHDFLDRREWLTRLVSDWFSRNLT